MASGAGPDRLTGQQKTRRPNRRRYWRRAFLDALHEGATVAEACVTSGCPSSTAYLNRSRDPAFAREWDDAYDAGTALIEGEIRRRAMEGWLEPQFYQGEVSGYVRRYDGRMLLRLAERRSAAWAQRQSVEHKGLVEHLHAHVIPIPCNGRDLLHKVGVCAACDAVRAGKALTIEHAPAPALPAPAPAPVAERAALAPAAPLTGGRTRT